MNILIVDDASETRAYLKFMVSKTGWKVYEASNGTTACEVIRKEKIEVLLTDWMMPEMDGIELIHWIRKRSAGNYIYTILLTSRDRESDLVTGLTSGADDFLTKPVNANILYARLQVAQRIQKLHQELTSQQQLLLESHELISTAYSHVKSDLEHAAHVQRSLLPQTGSNMDAISTAWFYRPAMGISGDHLNIYPVNGDKLVLYLLDVSGHGVTAALRSAAISQLLHPVSGLLGDIDDIGPARVLDRLNSHLVRDNADIDYLATIVLGVFDPATGNLRLAIAGHPPAILFNSTGEMEELSVSGLPLGIDSGARYRDNEAAMLSGTTLVLHSDGIPDCENKQGQQYGLQALRECLSRNIGLNSDSLVDKVECELEIWSGGADITDDQSMLLIRYKTDECEKADYAAADLLFKVPA